MRVSCPGVQVLTGPAGEAVCADSLGAPVAWEVQPEFDVAQLEPEMLAGAFAAGFIICATGWAIGYGFRVLLSAITSR